MKKGLLTLLQCLFLIGCTQIDTTKAENMNKEKHSNELIHETSPYLLQHAHNPVNWMPWGEKALVKAKKENKPLLISIGYSACHWCHVMEHESFEDTLVANIMNEHFICIKVDREERPDIDQIYMNAVQLMNGNGGWPLNCFATPDGRPFYGGTYFPKENWLSVLEQLQKIYKDDPKKVEEYANKLSEGVKKSDLIPKNESPNQYQLSLLKEPIEEWKKKFDNQEGGNNYAPKFPMPNNYSFLLHYAHLTKDQSVAEHLELTLTKMAYGGIYDQLEGGFSRYSTDLEWKVPHFEKMLYDNAQLIELYSLAYKKTKNPLFKEIVFETVQFVRDNLKAENGAYYSALDADSEGEEGKYYVWTKAELKTILAEDNELIQTHFNVNQKGLWENGNYILLRDKNNRELAQQFGLDEISYAQKVENNKKKLLEIRNHRVKPGLDDKSLSSWNALMIKALIAAYYSFKETSFLEEGIANAEFMLKHQLNEEGKIFHSYKDGSSTINGFLEDYSFTLEAFLALYEATADPKWLKKSELIIAYLKTHFYDASTGLFYFTSDEDPKLIARKTEYLDNVIPSSNSSLALALYKSSVLFQREDLEKISLQMLNNVQEILFRSLPSMSNWGQLFLIKSKPVYEVVIIGDNAKKLSADIQEHYLPNVIVIPSLREEFLPLMENKFVEGQTTIYVCQNKECKLPTTDINVALNQLNQ